MYYFDFPCRKCGKPVDAAIEDYGVIHTFGGSGRDKHEFRVPCTWCAHVHVAVWWEDEDPNRPK